MSISARIEIRARPRTSSTSRCRRRIARAIGAEPRAPGRRPRAGARSACRCSRCCCPPSATGSSLEGQVLAVPARRRRRRPRRRCRRAVPAGGRRSAADQLLLRRAAAHADVAKGDQALALVRVRRGRRGGQRRRRAGGPPHARRRARASEAETLSALAGADLDDADTLHRILDRARADVRHGVGRAARCGTRGPASGSTAEHVGLGAAGKEGPLRFDVPIGPPAADRPRAGAVRRGPAGLQGVRRRGRDRVRGPPPRRARHAPRGPSPPSTGQRTALLAAVGHDLRTPLAGIKAAVSSLRQRTSRGPRRAARAARDDRGLRRPARRGGRQPARRQPASRPGRSRSRRGRRARGGRRGGGARRCPPGPSGGGRRRRGPAARQADPGLLERVLANLIDNALRHGGGGGRSTISAPAGAGSAKLAVVDHGPGVPSSDERMFTPFQRLGDRRRAASGSGWPSRAGSPRPWTARSPPTTRRAAG